VAPHGLDGVLKLKAYNPKSPVLNSARDVILEKGGNYFPHYLERSSAHKGGFLIKLQGMDHIDSAKKWVGSFLSVTEDALYPLESSEYYYYQVMGLEVFDSGGTWIGKVKKIWFKEGGDLYVVAGESKEFLIPAVKEVVETIDFQARKMIINPPAGLLEL
jgi:16S rRNA processing protein RimM